MPSRRNSLEQPLRARSNVKQRVLTLITKGDTAGIKALHHSGEFSDPDFVVHSYEDDDGNVCHMSALAFASCVKQLDVMRVLIQLGSKVNEPRKLHHAPSVTAAFHCFTKGLSLLEEKGCELSLEDSTGLAPVHAAADQGHLSILRLLQRAGVPMDAKGKHSRCTPQEFAAKAGHTDCADFLLLSLGGSSSVGAESEQGPHGTQQYDQAP